jgi:hypothetical protein
MRMKRSFLYLFILMLLGTASTAFAQNGEIYGTVTDETNNPFPGVVIKVTQGGLMKGGTITEDDGTYSVKPLQPGTYTIQFSSTGYGVKEIGSITVSSGGSVKINNKMTVEAKGLKEVIKVAYKQPVVSKITAVGSDKIERAPTRNILDMASLGPNVQQTRNGGELRIGGARGDGTVYMLDGQVIQGAVTPAQGTVEQLQVFSSGIPANLGDATGGVVSITSKGLTNKLKGNVQAQHSVDGYNQNLVNASFTGPLVSRMRDGVKQPILGFLAGIDYQYDQDDNPTFIKNPVLKSDVLKRLQDNPLTLVNTSNGNVLLPSSNQVGTNDFVLQKQQLNNSTSTVRFNGKLDYAVNSNINVTAGGSFNYNNSQVYNRSNSYFAPDAIPTQIGATYRGYLRFKQSFNSKNTSGSGDSAKRAVISNAYYTVQLDYQLTTSRTEDPNFKRNLFDYGYVGKFTQSRVPIYQFGEDSLSGRKAVILQTLDAVDGIAFDPSDKNRILANYTRNVYQNAAQLGNLTDLTQVQRYRGLMNGDFPTFALQNQNATISNIGAGLIGYNYGTFSQVGLHADASFDFRPAKTTHAIQFGLYYEQRSSSNYSANINTGTTGSNSLWNRMQQLSNAQFNGFDYSNPIFVHKGVQYNKTQVDAGAFFGPADTIIYNRLITQANQSTFDANLRKKLGLGASDYIDIHSVDPSKLSLDMFSADELINQGQGFVSYNGYDYTGNKVKGQVNFNDFFTDPNRPIGAFSPNYIAGYVMDKFRFQDMNFNIGVRIERYDNNTKVLKDPYSLYELNKRGGVDGARNLINGGKHPENIGDDYAVYVNNNQSATPSIIGYRSNDKWYNAYGVEISDPAVLKTENGGTDPSPFLTPEGKTLITDAKFDPNRSFTDYKPKVTVSPRFQFDFPINDGKALFYAHYDILVQRPKTGNFATPLDYMYLANNTGNLIGNPDLKPEKTFDYELGYQQQVSNNSGIGISAFYRERKDMIQVRPYLFAWPQTYYTFGNRDFSTTKGFTFSYDYRKPKGTNIPIEMTLAYTLQFADGTGSSATSGNGGNGNQVSSSGLLQNFISSGLPNLRYVAPLTYDSRHNINLNFNYSYEENEGPTVNGKHFLQNFNANMIMRARSGEPYTTTQNVIGNQIQGGLNGTRLPWHFGIDLRLDKRFAVSGFGKKSATATDAPVLAKHKYYVTTFIYFQNLFNIKDVLGVYPYTSRPDDDGYITSPNGQLFVNSTLSPQSVQDLYSLYVNNPGFYNGPRRANVGFAFSF